MKKLKIAYPIIVEGKYDREKLLSICEGLIIKTDGFGIFKKEEKAALVRTLAKESPIIVLTDSDGGGRVIRSHVSALVPRDKLIRMAGNSIPVKLLEGVFYQIKLLDEILGK